MAEIKVDNFTKDYGNGRGAFNVGFAVNKGEVFGFLGPNGAGKSTTIRHLMGFSYPTSGKTFIKNIDSSKHADKIMASVGYLPGELPLPENMTGVGFIKYQEGLRGRKNRSYTNKLLKMFDLNPYIKIKKMSFGTKRKLAIVTAFMFDPDVVLLDEPTGGLDPIMQHRFLKLLEQKKKEGKTILLSTHVFSEAEAICDRIGIIKDGSLVALVDRNDVPNQRFDFDKHFLKYYEEEEGKHEYRTI
ncbi:MAG: ABC transporter ATP-binding protein [Candidatus Ancillula sp.]|jgi:ABC-2 type transport system ATP-binding protein|nr:ABC transporter ATP-binding protein [Candidatus Ancillula sp.]